MNTPKANALANALSPSRSALLRNAVLLAGAAAALSACGLRQPLQQAQHTLPESLRVPAGYTAVLEAQGRGDLIYECQAVKRAPYEYAWLLLPPGGIRLQDGAGNTVTYFPGARARWVHSDGSKVSAQELVEATDAPQNLPLQRAMVGPSETPGALANVRYIQARRTVGGVVANPACTSATLGMRVSVPFEADYVFWGPAG